MNIAIIIGISQYFKHSGEHHIIAPQKDASRIKRLLEATDKYKTENILYITENAVAAKVKKDIRSFLESYAIQEIEVEEIFYYFSGHGIAVDQEFHMLCSDYEKTKLNTTSIQNSDVDNFIRLLNPKLAVKVIDACFSGYRYLKDNSFSYGGNISSEKTLSNVIFMASSHDDQKSQMMQDSYFTEKFIEGALLPKIGDKVRYRDIQGFIADEFGSMTTQQPFFVNQCKGTEVFADYTETMQALKEEWYPENIREMEAEYPSNEGEDLIQVKTPLLDDELVKKIGQTLAESDALFVEKSRIDETLKKIKQDILDYKISDEIVNNFYGIHCNWDRKFSYIGKNPELLKIANIEKWSKKYLIQIQMKTVQEPVSNWQRQSLDWSSKLSNQLVGFLSQDTKEVQKPYSLNVLNSLLYEVIWIEFKPKTNQLSLTPFLSIIALIHSETEVLTLLNRDMMIKDGWQHFGVDLNSLIWNRQIFLWKDIIENPNLLWKSFFDETIQDIREYLIELIE
jgi:hypothetical protein